MITKYILLIMECIGTIAFAVSGSLVAISHSLDLFGVIIVACTTAVGGGIIRDILMGQFPPQIFYSHTILLLAVFSAAIVFIAAYVNSKKFKVVVGKIEHVNIVFDAIGLAAFSVAGVEAVCNAGFKDDILFCITTGVITGVGGGILRDVLVNEKPYVLTKHIYAVASILGSGIYYVGVVLTPYKIAVTALSLFVTICIRLLAAKYRWKLPKVDFDRVVGGENALHAMRLKEEHFNKIKNGLKTIELRLYDEKRKKLRVGDHIEFTDISTGETLKVRITALHLFESFEKLYENLPAQKCGYREGETARPSDMNKYYSVEEQAQSGVVGIEFKVLKNAC